MAMSSNDLQLSIGANLNLSTVKSQLSDFKKKVEKTTVIQLNGIETFRTLSTYVNDAGQSFKALELAQKNASGELVNYRNEIISTTNKMQNLNKTVSTHISKGANGSIVQTITDVNSKGQIITKTITQMTDSMGKVTTTTRVYNETLKQEVSLLNEEYLDEIKLAEAESKRNAELIKLQKTEKDRLANISTTTIKNTELYNGYKATVTTMTELNKEGQNITTTTRQYKNALGETVTETTKFDDAGNKVSGTVTNITKGVKTLGQSFGNIITKVAKFYLASLPIRLIQNMITSCVTTVKELDDALTDFRKVSDLAWDTEGLQNYLNKLSELGETVGRTTTEMVEGATQFKRAGYSEEDSATLAQLSAMYQNTADEILSASESASVIISQMKAFNYTAENAIHIIDSINKVSANFAVSSSDIGKGLTQAGASLQTYGNSFDEVVGLVTAGTEIFQGKSQQVARGLNTISARISKNAEALKKYGVDIYDTNGELKSTFDILSELKPQWDKMSSAQQVALGQTLAGTNQYKVFSAVMSNFQTALDATTASFMSAGATEKQNEIAMDSLEMSVKAVKVQLQQFVIGNGGLKDFATFLLNVAEKITKVINDLGGLKTVLLTVVSLILISQREIIAIGLVDWFNRMKNRIVALITEFKAHITAVKSGTIANQGFAVSMSTITGAVGIAILAITSIVSIVQAFSNNAKEAQKSAKEMSEEMESYRNSVDSLDDVVKKLQNENITREELNDIIDKNLSAYKKELNAIEDVQEAREQALKVLQAYNKEEAEEKAREGLGNYKSAKEALDDTYDNMFTVDLNNISMDALSFIDETLGGLQVLLSSSKQILYGYSIDGLDNYIEKLKQVRDYLQNTDYDKYSYLIDVFNEAIVSATEKQENYNQIIIDEEYLLNKAGLKLNEQGNLVAMTATEYADASSELEDFEEDLDLTTESIELLNKKLAHLSSISLEDISDGFDTINSALEDYNKNGRISVNTYEELMSLSADYLSALLDEEGALRNTTEAEIALCNAKIDEMAIDKAKELVQNAIDIEALGQNYSDYAKNIEDATSAQWNLVDSTIYLAVSEGKLSEEGATALLNQTSRLRDWANQAKESLRISGNYKQSVSDSTDSLEENTKTLKANVDAIKARKDALNDELDDYKTVISYINDKISDQIDKIKDEKDSELDAIDEEIDALKDKQNAIKDLYDSQIDALEEAKDADKEYWDNKINALKEANDELSDQIEYENLLNDLETAKSTKVKVYKEGQGFVYDTDQSAIAKAQQAINEYNRKKAISDRIALLEKERDDSQKIYEQQIQDLKDKQEAESKNYDKQISDLEEYKKQKEKYYDTEIKKFEDYKDKFSKQVNSYETEQNRLLALQLTGIDFEKDNWDTRLGNLDSFVLNYSNKLSELKTLTEKYDKAQLEYEEAKASYEQSKTNKSPKTTDNTKAKYWTYNVKGILTSSQCGSMSEAYSKLGYYDGADDVIKVGDQYRIIKWGQGYFDENTAKTSADKNKQFVYERYASGSSYIDSNQVALVGDSPNAELILGSKINGSLTQLTKGSGVVNATSTKTLAGLLNQLGSYATNGFGSGNGILADTNRNEIFTINTVNIDGSNITDVNSFKNALVNLKSETLQRAYRH